jgi:uncharacterized delta-60 repeat protein
MKKTISTSLFSVLVLVAALNVSALRPGDLDPSFGSGGKVYNLPANFMPAEDVAVQADGKLVLVGSTFGPDQTQDFAVVRLNANGTPDNGFGTGGLVGIPFDTNFNEMAVAVVIQADGKIVVAGSVQLGSAGWDFGIVRLNTNGTTDGTYNGGKVKVGVNTSGGDDFVFDMALQADGKVVITGTTRPTPNKDIAVVRMATNGALDFRLTIASGGGLEDEGLAIAVQPDQHIVVAGSIAGDFVVLRLTPTVGLDASFGTGGIALTPIGTQNDRATSVAIQGDGKIVAAGTANSGSFDEFAFARYTTAGQPDPTFDGDGKVSYDVRASNSDILSSVLIQSDGKIIGVGTSGGSYVLVRLDTPGGLDASFGVGGKAVHNVAPTTSGARRAILLPDGKILAVGDGSGPGTFGFTAARFLTVGRQSAPFDFDGDGRTDVGIVRPSVGEWWINRSQTDSVIVAQFGSSTDKFTPADFTGDGKTDIAIWRPTNGVWFVLRSEDFSFYAFPFGTGGDVPVTGDFDADGKADAGVFRPSEGNWYIFQSGPGGVLIQPFGTNGDIPVPADYDGDARTDIAIYRPSTGQWWINRSTSGVVVASFGTPTDKFVYGDYTGDNRADIAFWRPADGVWFVLRSEDFSFYAFPFGTSGDLPAPGDYDGDGKFDATIFRPSQATWYSQRSAGGVDIRQFGVSTDRPIPNLYVP